jgi:solute carrier family 44 (choline transporter-like protein), member 2/4/5
MSKNEANPTEEPKSKMAKNKYLDPDYKGEPLDDKLADGPVENRGCTDCLCCLLFVAFVAAWFTIGIYGFANGDPLLLTYPFDSYQHQCGRGVTSDYSYVYYPYPFPGYTTYRACLKSCPTSSSSTLDCYTSNPGYLDCTFTKTVNVYGYYQTVSLSYQTTEYLGRFCLPGSSLSGIYSSSYNEINSVINISVIQQWLGDVYTVWQVILIVAGAALGIAFVYMILLRFCIGVIVWTSILFTIGIIVVFAAFFQWAAYNLYNSDTDPDTVRNLKILAYTLYALAFLIMIYIFYMCNKIRLAIAIMKVGTQYIRDVWLSLCISPCCFILIVGIYAYWVAACLYLYSSGSLTSSSGTSPFASVNWDNNARSAFYFEFFGILWVNAFLLALGQFILASSVCIWYFSVNSDSGPQRPISRSLWRAFRYHLGSIAFGSLILAIVWAIKYILMYIQGKIKQTGASQNSKVVEWILRILTCYVLCFERFIKFLNKNAYIQVALNATSFCASARNAFFLILRNASRFLAVGSIGAVFMFLGKWVITLAASYIGYMLITRVSTWKDSIHSPIFPTVVFILLSYSISGLFMSVYGMACDTILQCFLADEELSSRNRGAPAHSPQLLMDFMGKERQKDHTARCCDCC